MVHDRPNDAEMARLRAKAVQRLQRSAPPVCSSLPSGESEPSVMPDSSGADTHVSQNVFDGVRPLSDERVEALRKNYRKAVDDVNRMNDKGEIPR